MKIPNLIILTILLFVSSCSVRNWYKPMGYRIFKQMPKGGSPGFELGWIHGCESGLATQFGGAIYMSFYKWKKDPDIVASNRTPEQIKRIKRRYKKELKNINWEDSLSINKNFSDYNRIFWLAHIFCRHAALGGLQMSGMTPPLPGQTRYDPGAHSIGNVYKINATGDTRLGTGYW